ncbi:MAG: hypothetical protein HKO62_09145, partial [Gammaproteobacteria bacterium]|nr:hypothetical protein [Gammaproteobacteria bacterium]
MIVILTALPAEARPLIEALELDAPTAANAGRLPLYTGADHCLLVSGTGSHAAAAAVGYAAAALDTAAHSAWLNVGIAGSPSLDPGAAIVADRIVDAATGMTAYPFLTPGVNADCATVTTVAEPDTDYRHAGAVDMEAWGFFAAATRFATLEQVQCLKVISDGPRHPAARLNAGTISALVAEQIPLVRT